jgi:hypothetical protein
MGKGLRGVSGTSHFTPPSRSESKSSSSSVKAPETPKSTPSTTGRGGAADKKPVTVYRVEGPDNQRVSINDAGKAHVSKSFNSATNQSKPGLYNKPLEYQDRAFLNFGDRARAEEFLAVRHDQGHTQTVMKAFDVPRDTFDQIRKSAVPENAARVRGNEHRPIEVDVNKGDNQFGLNWKSLQTVNSTSIPGSGRIERSKPDMLMHPEVSQAVQDLFQ